LHLPKQRQQNGFRKFPTKTEERDKAAARTAHNKPEADPHHTAAPTTGEIA